MNIHQARSRLKQVGKEIDETRTTVTLSQRLLAKLEKEQVELTKFLNTPQTDVSVSDHALIRYLERKYGFDLNKYRQEILTPERISAIKAGAESISVDGIKMKITNNVVVTVLSK